MTLLGVLCRAQVRRAARARDRRAAVRQERFEQIATMLMRFGVSGYDSTVAAAHIAPFLNWEAVTDLCGRSFAQGRMTGAEIAAFARETDLRRD